MDALHIDNYGQRLLACCYSRGHFYICDGATKDIVHFFCSYQKIEIL